MPIASVVIRSYNEALFIGRLFDGLRSQRLKDFEVILVDSGSTDDTVKIAKRNGARIVTISKEEFSFGRSLNRGCAEAQSDILVFVSAHVYPTRRDWLETLIAPFADERVAITYGKQRGNEISKFSECQVFAQWFPDISDPNQEHPFCNNANCAVRKRVWEQLRYDEALTGLEDLAFAKQALRRAHRIAYSAEAEIVHVHDETWDRVYNRYFREALALRRIEPDLQFGFHDFIRLSIANVLTDLRVARRGKVLRKELESILKFRFNQFWGTYRGHRYRAPIVRSLKERFYFPPAIRRDATDLEERPNHDLIDYAGNSSDPMMKRFGPVSGPAE